MLSDLRGERPRALQARGFIRHGHGLSNFSCRVHRITAFPFIYQIVLMILITRVVSIIEKGILVVYQLILLMPRQLIPYRKSERTKR